uniref:Uncharacterized protein n=1 Tax=Nonomuraea gerenzanensis TaxID=93944 RepID=A0A1M4EEP7_9ACTN|nr:hypothetical protein BN4615_P6778 [Nonomuraea gerenzanensis]
MVHGVPSDQGAAESSPRLGRRRGKSSAHGRSDGASCCSGGR